MCYGALRRREKGSFSLSLSPSLAFIPSEISLSLSLTLCEFSESNSLIIGRISKVVGAITLNETHFTETLESAKHLRLSVAE